ncbi:MAG: fibronectin type III domain-containing protein, partial [Bacteroidota bacterium]
MTIFQKAMSRGVALVMAFNLMTGMASAEATELATPVITSPTQNEVLKNFPREATIQWNMVTGAEKYNVEVEMGFANSTTWTRAFSKTVTGTSVKTDGLSADNSFRVHVQAATASTVGNWSEYRNFSYNTTPVSVGKVFITAKIENGQIQIDWPALAGLGTTFDYYNVRSKKDNTGPFEMDTDGVTNAYITWDYYNTTREAGKWLFMVTPVKWVDGKYQEVNQYGTTVG